MSTDPESPQEVSNPEASKQPDQDGKSIDKKSDGVMDSPDQEMQSSDASSKLTVLSPHFDEEHHGLYVKKLEQAVLNPKVRHIALTGGYGTGKSSVIQGLIEKIHSSKELKKIRPITISLPTIQIADESDSEDDRTDRIQREIVKQLLYRSNPRKMRGSQYRRITHITVVQRTTACFIVAAILTFIFWLLAKPDWHWHWSRGGSLWGYWQPAMVQAILWGLTFYVDWMWVNKPALKGLQLGPAKLELEKNDSSYFDKYLNEIIYYFEVSGTNLVIFEDLDRFNEPYIFDALHELNELINISLGQERFTEQKNPPVKFLYATRDSIFEHKTKGIIENADARYAHRLEIENRTKFFDVIVPIVPFSTSRNAYEYLKQMIDNSASSIDIDRKLLEIVGSEISDYRLLANIVSEFQIFTKQIVASWVGTENTEEFLNDHANYLFAFIVYKNTHLTDYEKIQTGESNIDKLNIVFLETVTNINEIIDGIFDNLGDKLRKYIIKKFGPHEYKIVVNDTSFNFYSDIKLWESAIDPKICDLTENFPDISLVDSSTTLTTIINGEVLMQMMISELKDNTPEAFLMYREDEISNYFKEIIREIFSIAGLTTAYTDDFSVLSLRLSRYNNIGLESSRFIDKIQKEINKFIEFTEKTFGNDRMAQELINNQFINGSFHVYSSIFNGEFSNSRAFNFIIQHVMTGVPNVAFQLNEQESREIVYQIERHYLNRHYSLMGALNADLMLYLEKHRSNSIVLSCMLNEVADCLKYNHSDIIGFLFNKIKQIGDKQGSDYECAKRLLHKIKDYAAAVNIEAYSSVFK
ncbi:hypothetical protein [Corynebacterium matruchotii]|uniref:YobI family P-loop NTPase n=1 Tax=Corynebacterium matruchotii TaxID=43768 RepID=UPI003C71AAD7